MKRILTILLLGLSVSVFAQTGPAPSVKFATKVLLDAYTPDLADNQAVFGYVTTAGADEGLWQWSITGSNWMRPDAIAAWGTMTGIPAGFADNTDDVNDADFDPNNELVTTFQVNGANLELIDAGGTKNVAIASLGTDDQTAAEVPVTATGFTGNLSATDTDIQTALATIDGLALGTDAQGLSASSTATAGTLEISGGTNVDISTVIENLPGPYDDDAAATTAGVATNKYYRVTGANPYGLQAGAKKLND